MPFSRVPLADLDIRQSSGAAFPPGVQVFVYARGTVSPITLYAASSGGTTITQPTTVDSNGNAIGWALPQDVTVAVTSTAGTVSVDMAIMPSVADLTALGGGVVTLFDNGDGTVSITV